MELSSVNHPTGGGAIPGRLIARLSDKELAKRQFKAGEAYYERGDYEAALAEFEKSYRNSRKPKLLFNIALTLEKLKRYQEALDAYRLYLQAESDSSLQGFVESQITLLEDLLAKVREAEAQAAPATSPPPPPPPSPPPLSRPTPPPKLVPVLKQDVYLPPKPEEPAVQVARETPGQAPYGFLKWTSLSLSVAGLALGGIAYQRAGKKESEHGDLVRELVGQGRLKGSPGNYHFTNQKDRETYEGRLNGLKQDISSWDTRSMVGFISGGALLALGGVFFWLDHQQQARLELQAKPAGGSVLLRVGF